MVSIDINSFGALSFLLLDFRIWIKVGVIHWGLLGKGDCMVREPEYRYAIEIFWSKEDDCFIACVPDLENCAAWGMSYEEALAQAPM